MIEKVIQEGEGEPIPEWLTEERLSEHVKLAGPHTARDNGMYTGAEMPGCPRQVNDIDSMARLRNCIDGYDCGIRYMDDHIGKILDFLDSKGLLEDTAIIVTADHGENFGELGMYSEHGTADNITCRIPMIVKWPGMKKGHVDTGLHYNLDLAVERPAILAEGAEKLEGWRSAMLANMPFGYSTDPMDTVMEEGGPFHANPTWAPIKEYKERLKETGR